jgi:hypothetical protein
MAGGIQCWDCAAPAMDAATGFGTLEVGESGMCGLCTNDTITCFYGAGSPSDELANAQYVSVKAHDVAC